jgi:hypothetical protein
MLARRRDGSARPKNLSNRSSRRNSFESTSTGRKKPRRQEIHLDPWGAMPPLGGSYGLRMLVMANLVCAWPAVVLAYDRNTYTNTLLCWW